MRVERDVLRKENEELREERDRWKAMHEEEHWPFEWVVASALKRERDEARAALRDPTIKDALTYYLDAVKRKRDHAWMGMEPDAPKLDELVTRIEDLLSNLSPHRGADRC